MQETKQFHIGDILSVTSGILVSPSHIGGVYEILGWMVNDEGIMTHQLPRISFECEGFLKELFPELVSIDVASAGITDDESLALWFKSLEPIYGTHREVPRLPEEDHTHIDPIAELRMMKPGAEIIVVSPESED